jgi:hypothetical protein
LFLGIQTYATRDINAYDCRSSRSKKVLFQNIETIIELITWRFYWLDVEGIVSAPCSCSESILFDWMVLESVDLSACLFLLVAGSLVYIIVVGKSLSTMSLYVFFFCLCLCVLSVFCWYYYTILCRLSTTKASIVM